ncbi:MAG: FAD-dependent oxidoreductase [Actinomycetota bacterium]|nr:FAD-dependent oxidoreductase [Actinomycetota bacterium]
MATTYVIIGAIAAGTSAAAKIRRASEDARIIMFDKDRYISYGTCGLPYYVSGTINHMSRLLINTVKNFEKRFNLKVYTRHEVTQINLEDKTLAAKDLESGKVFTQDWDKLILATGSNPIMLDMPGLDSENVFALKTIDDSLRLKKYLDRITTPDPSAVIIGGGFIGLELLDAFLGKNMKVTILEKTSQLLPMFDFKIVEYLHNYLRDKGINLLTGEQAQQFITKDQMVAHVYTKSGKKIPADLVFMGIGTRPSVDLAKKAGIAIGESGAIEVDQYMQTNVDGVYAAGDCCQCIHNLTGRHGPYNLASIANRQGRAAGYNAAGGQDSFEGTHIASIIKVLDLALAKTGISFKEAKSAGIDAGQIEVHYLDHAGYYPGAEMIHMLLIYDRKNGAVLGLQAIGRKGVDKRADIVSTAIKAKLNIEDLGQIDLCYQPEYGSAKDPINILGMIGENLGKDEVEFIDTEELGNLRDEGRDLFLLDVRTEKEFSQGHIEGAVNIHIDQLRENLGSIGLDKLIIIYCQTGYRAYLAYRIMVQKGYKVKLLNGSYLSWIRKI